MESSKGKLELTVRSRKVTRLVEYDAPMMTPYGRVGSVKRWARVSDYVLDERQREALSEAQELARKAGLPLDVTDLSRQGALRRVSRLVRINLEAHARHSLPSGLGDMGSAAQDRCDITSQACQP